MNRGNRQLPFLIAAIGGGFLFLSLFLEWLSGPSLPAGAAGRLGLSKTGWELFNGVDIFLAILGIATIVYCVLWLLGIEQWPWLRAFVRWGGLVGILLVLNYMVDQDNAATVTTFSSGLGIGVYVALAASLAMLAGGLLLVRPDLAQRLEDAAGGGDRARADAATRAGAGEAAGTAAAQPAPAATAPQPPTAPARPQAPAAPSTPAAPAAPAGGAAAPPTAQQPAAAPAAPAQAGLPPEPAAAQPGPPAGWYPDPQGLARLRYWDGSAWTEHTSA